MSEANNLLHIQKVHSLKYVHAQTIFVELSDKKKHVVEVGIVTENVNVFFVLIN